MSDNFEQYDRLAPQNIDAEISVLGSVLIDYDGTAMLKAKALLQPDDFYRRDHGDIFEAMLALHDQRVPIDLVTLGDELERRERLNAIGGPAYLTSLMNMVPTSVHVEHYAGIVRDKARLRGLIAAAGKIAAAAYEEANDAGTAEARASSILLEATERGNADIEVVTPQQQADVLVDLLDRRSQGQSLGLQTGFRTLDSATGGLRRGDLIILGARPGAGKSSFAEVLAENLAKKDRFVIFISLEMDAEQLMERWAAREGRITTVGIKSGRLTESEWASLWQIAETRSKLPLYLLNVPGIGLSGMEAGIEHLAMQVGRQPDLVVIDYLQLINEPRGRGESRADQVARMTRSLKLFARRAHVPVLLLSQLNRDSARRGTNPEPTLADLRDSGGIEQDADLVLMFWNAEENGQEYFNAKIEKQRNGPICDLSELHFDKPHFDFYERAVA